MIITLKPKTTAAITREREETHKEPSERNAHAAFAFKFYCQGTLPV